MRLRDYVRGIPVRGHSPFPAEECARRINAARASALGLDPAIPAGRVTPRGHLRLQRRSVLGYRAKPILTGELWPEKGGTRFDLRYGAAILDLGCFGFQALAALLFLGLAVFGLPGAGSPTVEFVVAAFAMVGGAAAIMWIAHEIGTRKAMEDLRGFLAFLERETGATFEPPAEN